MAAEGFIESCEVQGGFWATIELAKVFFSGVGAVDVFGLSLDDGFTVGKRGNFSTGGEAFAVGADEEGIATHGEGGADALEDIGLHDVTGDTS